MSHALIAPYEMIAKDVARFSAYTKEIESLLGHLPSLNKPRVHDEISARILNGETTLALERLVPVEIRKRAGLFFTNSALADKVADRLAPVLRTGTKLLDPACGAGNLLISCARHLPIGANLSETLALWSKLVHGYDYHVEFIRTAQLRLLVLALSFHADESSFLRDVQADQIFTNLRSEDAFLQSDWGHDTCIVVNPPFGYINSPAGCDWATGKIQVAAFFLEQLLRRTAEGQHIAAILPDVLRSGTRYKAWRDTVSSLCSLLDVEPAGRFDRNTDVDVFIMHAVNGKHNHAPVRWHTPDASAAQGQHVVSDFFNVHVGPVVPHRDPTQGPCYPYIHARTAPAWQTVEIIAEERRYSGTVFSPPFIVVHRTSSPSDIHRCVATIVNEERDVAVENHLLVLEPHDKSLESCRQLLSILRSPQTDEWLNSRIRCRHLTVAAITELPCRAIVH